MKVSELRQHIADLSKVLASSGAATVSKDLQAIADGLAPFRDASLKEFADFLIRADAFSRGTTPDVPLTSPKGGGKSKGKAPKPIPEPSQVAIAVAREIQRIYESAGIAPPTDGVIDEAMNKVRNLIKDDMAYVAEKIGINGMRSKNKGPIEAAIRLHITARRGSKERTDSSGVPGNGRIDQSVGAFG